MSYAAFNATLDAIYSAAARPDCWPEALACVADYAGGGGVAGSPRFSIRPSDYYRKPIARRSQRYLLQTLCSQTRTQ
jgi:hypothetical protein